MKKQKTLKIIGSVAAVCVLLLIIFALLGDDEDSGIEYGAITLGEYAEGILSGDEEFGGGFVDMSGEGEYDPDKSVMITKSARPIRRIVKQDVYGREFSESFYFYRNMLNDNEKKLYDQVYANAVELDPYFEISTSVPYERLQNIIIAVRYDNPDLFWLDYKYFYTYDKNGYVTSMTLTFFEEAVNNIDAFKQNFNNCADSVLEYVMTLDNDIDKVKYCHDVLTNINTYEWADMNQSAYSALCYGKTVCAGYSFAFSYLMQRLGIPCTVIYGNATEDHLWNILYIDGEYYEMDITWDDPIGNPPTTYYYNYFNITSGQMSSNHRRYGPSESLPTATGSVYSYFNYYGNSPGSDFSQISYGNPSRSIPPIYPNATLSQLDEGDLQSDYDIDEVLSGEHEGLWTYDDVDAWLDSMSDDEWSEFWELLTEDLSDEEYEILYEMDWEDFISFLVTSFNS